MQGTDGCPTEMVPHETNRVEGNKENNATSLPATGRSAMTTESWPTFRPGVFGMEADVFLAGQDVMMAAIQDIQNRVSE